MRGPEETLRLFDDESGFLTDHALQSLLNGSLEELERLEVAEHLSYCDSCVERYTALLVPQVLEEPPELMKQSILSALRKRAAKLFVDRYFHMAVAASLTLVLWGSGVFNTFGQPIPLRRPDTGTEEHHPRTSVSQRLGDFAAGVTGGINDIVDQITAIDLRGADRS